MQNRQNMRYLTAQEHAAALYDYRRTGNADAARDAGLTTAELLIAPPPVIRDVLTWHGHGFDEVRGWRITEPFESRCERVIVHLKRPRIDGEPILVIFSEPTDEFNPGCSVTNSLEYIATLTFRHLPELLGRATVAKESVRWFEYYGYARIRREEYPLQFSLTEATFTWSPDEKRFTATQWQPIRDQMLLARLKNFLKIT